MWPHMFKFALTNPELIYKSVIYEDGNINTMIFPTLNNTYIDCLQPLTAYSKATTLTLEVLKKCIKLLSINCKLKDKQYVLNCIESYRIHKNISNKVLCDILSNVIYLPKIIKYKKKIPNIYKKYFKELR